MLPDVFLKQREGPKFLSVAKLLRFLTCAVLHPSDGVIGNAAALARPRKFSQCGLQSKLKKFANAQGDGMPIHAAIAGNCPVAHSTGRVQKNRRVQYLPFLSTAGPAEAF